MNEIDNRARLSALATWLNAHRADILARWRAAVENDPELTIVSSLTRLQFNDHIPGVLDVLEGKLRAWPADDSARTAEKERTQVTGHGLERWQQGYQLRELTREWAHLQSVTSDALEDYADTNPDGAEDVMRVARRVLSRLCWNGVSDSSTQYWRLHQAEAAGHVRDLERALATLNELDRARATAWHEAAHDLRGSVSVVTTASAVLERPGVPEPMREKSLDLVKRGVSSLHEMLNDLMALARLEAGQEQRVIAPFDAGVLLGDFCNTSMPLADAQGLYLKVEGPSAMPVYGDRAKVRRILQNLLLNALKYTRRGGVRVIWGAVPGDETNNWMFCVQDTGPGLVKGPAAPLAQALHEATVTTHEGQELRGETDDHVAPAPTLTSQTSPLAPHQQPGEGVGLSIVKRLCELLDASLELETSPGEGSTFRVTLPCRYEPAPVHSEKPLP